MKKVFLTSKGSLWSPAKWWLQIWTDIWTKIRVLTQGGRCSPTHRVHVLSRWGWAGRTGRSVHRPRLCLPHAHPLPQSSSGRAGPEDTACLQKLTFYLAYFSICIVYTVLSEQHYCMCKKLFLWNENEKILAAVSVLRHQFTILAEPAFSKRYVFIRG